MVTDIPYNLILNAKPGQDRYELWENSVTLESEDLAGVKLLQEPGNTVSDDEYPQLRTVPLLDQEDGENVNIGKQS